MGPTVGTLLGAMILIAYRHGLRASELVSLRWSDVDLERGTLFDGDLRSIVD
jgi:integrase